MRTEKPWGYEELLINNGLYVIKELGIYEGHRISLQYHKIKHETWYILSGRGWVIIYGRMERYGDRLGKLCIYDIPPGTIHRVSAEEDLTRILEVSTPELDDVVRIEDDYGRV